MSVKNRLIGGGSKQSIEIYHIVQTIDGDTCTLSFSDYNSSVTTDNYLVAVYQTANGQKIYILDEYEGV